jgi:hypothetical protein
VQRPKLLELATVFGYIGGGAGAYVVYPHWAALHGWGMNRSPQIEQMRDLARAGGPSYLPEAKEEVRKAHLHLTPMRWDIGLGVLVLFFVSAAFLIAGAAVLYPRQMLPGGFVLLSHQAAIWEQISPFMVPVYYVSVLAALWGSLYAIPEINSRITHEFLGGLFASVRQLDYRRVYLLMGIYLGTGCVLVIWTGLEPVTMMDIAAMISANFAIMLSAFGALWLDASLPKIHRMGKPMLVGMILTTVVLTLVSAASITQMYVRYMG